MLSFAAAVFFLITTPGPGVLSTAGVAAGFGFRPASRYLFGLFLGNNLVSFLVISGLGAVVLASPSIRTILFAISIIYRVYLALKIGFAGAKIGFIESAAPPGILNGVVLQIFNPKAYVVSTSLFSGFAFLPHSYLTEVIVKVLVFNAIWIPIHFLWLFLGIYLNRLDLSHKTQRVINIVMAGAMLGVVGLAILVQGG